MDSAGLLLLARLAHQTTLVFWAGMAGYPDFVNGFAGSRWLTRDSAPVCPVVGPEGPAKGGRSGAGWSGLATTRTTQLSPGRRNIIIGPIRTTVWPGDGVTSDPGLNAQQGCQAALRWTWDESPDAVRFYTGTPRLQPGSLSRDVRRCRGKLPPLHEPPEHQLGFLGHTAIPPLPHSHALEPESSSGINPLSRIRARRSSVDIMSRRNSLSLLWLRARSGGLAVAAPTPSHPAPCARRQLISFAPRRYESARYFVLRLWVSNDALHRGPNSFQAGVEGRSLDNPGLGTCCVRGCPGG